MFIIARRTPGLNAGLSLHDVALRAPVSGTGCFDNKPNTAAEFEPSRPACVTACFELRVAEKFRTKSDDDFRIVVLLRFVTRPNKVIDNAALVRKLNQLPADRAHVVHFESTCWCIYVPFDYGYDMQRIFAFLMVLGACMLAPSAAKPAHGLTRAAAAKHVSVKGPRTLADIAHDRLTRKLGGVDMPRADTRTDTHKLNRRRQPRDGALPAWGAPVA